VTYHGPGQLVIYFMLDLRRRNLGIKDLISRMQQSVIELLQGYGITAHLIEEAPGVYVNNAKIAALGLRVKSGGSYHGLSLNVSMDLSPFEQINPCGYPDMQVTQLADLGGPDDLDEVSTALLEILLKHLN
jgi:lipoyl(octanoyl) transferase